MQVFTGLQEVAWNCDSCVACTTKLQRNNFFSKNRKRSPSTPFTVY